MTSDATRYLTPETLAEYFRAGTTTMQPLSSSPPSRLRIDPTSETLELFVPAQGAEPDITSMSRMNLDVVDLDGNDWFQLQVDAQGMHHEAYSVLASIVDDMTSGYAFVTATSNALHSYRDLLNKRAGLTPERQQGLIGELMVLRYLRDRLGGPTALESWLGPAAEQHDFAFAAFDAEVKTTTSERRNHRIGTENQLEPSVDRPLWLVSVQLTRAGAAGAGESLASMVGEMRTSFGMGNDRFLDALRTIGWRDDDHDLYQARYVLRTAPGAYRVDTQFPAITRPRVDTVVPKSELVSEVSYRVDLTTLDSETPPAPLAGFVEEDSA